MSFRLAPVVILLLSACAAWDTSSPNQGPPPAETPTPSSHYAPPPPARPGDPGDAEASIRVAIASVQLIDDCPEPEAERAARADQDEAKRAPGERRSCSQSTVQLSLASDQAGAFRVEAVRVLDGVQQRVVGSAALRGPTRWEQSNGSYLPWNEQVAAGGDLKISYKLGRLSLPDAEKLAGGGFNGYSGPFVLELDVAVDGVRRTVRSPQFVRQNDDMVET